MREYFSSHGTRTLRIHGAPYFYGRKFCVCILLLQIIYYEEVLDPLYELSQIQLRLNKLLYDCPIALLKRSYNYF
jgi:hypothetical protein